MGRDLVPGENVVHRSGVFGNRQNGKLLSDDGSLFSVHHFDKKIVLQRVLLSANIQMAHELGAKKIRVNTVIPTWMWGPPVEGYVKWQARERGIPEAEVKAEIEAKFPLGEIPADDDVAEVVVLFCSDRMRMVTGQFLRVDGGEKLG